MEAAQEDSEVYARAQGCNMEVLLAGEAENMVAKADGDWGGSRGDRRSTSGGLIMIGSHCIKTWSSTQGAIALSSAEAEFYAMVDAVLRAKWLKIVSNEMGSQTMRGQITLGTDSAAAKSFVGRRGLGRMRHIEVRDLWLQKEVLQGKVAVEKIPGDSNPADLMTKYLNVDTIEKRLNGMGLVKVEGNAIRNKKADDYKGEHKLVGGRWADEDGEGGEDDARQVVDWWRRR